MPLHIKDEGTTATVRALAKFRNVTLTEAVKLACKEALARDKRAQPVAERLAAVHLRVRAAPKTGQKADKEFFDAAWGEAQ